jgi:hypothetical protein
MKRWKEEGGKGYIGFFGNVFFIVKRLRRGSAGVIFFTNSLWDRGKGAPGVTTLLWPSVGVKPNTWKSWDLESFGTPECSELDNKTQNTSHWGVLGVIGKVLKRRYRKCPRIGNSDIYSPSYGQKKGRESNCQFDSRPLKVGNRPLPDVRFEFRV